MSCATRTHGVCKSSRSCVHCRPRTFGGRANDTKVACWAQDLNGETTPFDIPCRTHKKYWFRCVVCTHTFYRGVNHVVTRGCGFCYNKERCADPTCKLCTEHSFAGTTYSRALKCWMQERNNCTPRDVALNDNNKYWFKCDAPECGHEWDASLNNINNGRWCPYCDNTLRCSELMCQVCTANSFASTPCPRALRCWVQERNSCTPRDVALNCHDRKFWFRCDEPRCGHEWSALLGNINLGNWCPYCSSHKRCSSESCEMCTSHSFAGTPHPRALNGWMQDKNVYTPREVALNCSARKYWFRCDEPKCGHEWDTMLCNINNGKWCPMCTRKTERKLLDHLHSSHERTDITPQYRLSTMPRSAFDFLVISRRVLIELDGDQHFRQVMDWLSHDTTRERDVIKMNAAVMAGLHFIRIYQVDVFEDLNDWRVHLAAALAWLTTQHTMTTVYMAFGTSRYDQHSLDLSETVSGVQQVMMGGDGSFTHAGEAIVSRGLNAIVLE